MIALLLAACAGLPPAVEAPPLEVLHQFAISARGQTFAGMAAVQLDGPAYTLVAITPGGLELFSVRGDADTQIVSAPQEDLQGILARLPLGRDLHLLYAWSCGSAPKCSAGGGTVTEGAVDGVWTRTWKGPGGPATVVVEAGRATLEDPRRGYTLRVVGEELRVPHP